MTSRILVRYGLVVSALLGSLVPGYSQQVFERHPDGISVKIKNGKSGGSRLVRLEVKGEKIIHVIACPDDKLPSPINLMTIPLKSDVKWSVTESEGKIQLKTPALLAELDETNGSLAFKDLSGNSLLEERSSRGRSFERSTYSGEVSYKVKQVFESPANEALYGLGQHQDDIMNYKGEHVELFQYNTKVAIPFMLSSRNYGLLWNNYSYTCFGDVRELQPLSTLKLFSEKGEEGWLTATYGSRSDKAVKAIVKAESEIDYSSLKDQHKFPAGFNLSDGRVVWSGKIASGESGSHSFDLKYAGYIKVWIDGKLLADKWRQAWNPGSAVFRHSFEKNKKYDIQIEWLPDGSESYLSLRCLTPVPAEDNSTFAFESQSADAIDYYFMAGENADEVISGYRTVTGKAVMLPKWAMGFWQSRERYKTQEELINTVREYRARKIPLDNIVQDWSYWKENEWGSQQFDKSRFPDPAGMIAELHKKYNTNFVISVWPKFYEGIAEYNEMYKQGWLYKRNIADQRRDWIGKGYTSTFYDALNPQARAGFWNLLNKNLYTLGVDGWWMDAAEPDVHSNLDMATRQSLMSPNYLGSGVKYFNAFPLGNAMGIYEGQRKVNDNKRPLLLTRSAYGGQQRYATIVWSGDIASRWEDMRSQISAGINFSMSGIPYWSMDAGGFSVERRYEKPDEADLAEWRELNARWFQFAAFVPVFRSHGQYPYREIYNIAPEEHPAYESMLYYNKLRYRLMPYIYSLAGMAYHHDYTIMRGLPMDFPADNSVLNIGDEYMFGPSLLIAPVYTYKALSRQVYLPAGSSWYDLYSGKMYPGGQAINAMAPYERTPVFVRAGSLLPVGPEMQHTTEKAQDPLTLYVYTGQDGGFTLYDDQGVNNDYEKGAFTEIPLKYHEQSGTLTLGKRKGSFKGMMPVRTFNIVWISKSSALGIDQSNQNNQIIKYHGDEITITKN